MAKISNQQPRLTKKQKEAIAEQIANYFFDFWEERGTTNKPIKGKGIIRKPHKG